MLLLELNLSLACLILKLSVLQLLLCLSNLLIINQLTRLIKVLLLDLKVVLGSLSHCVRFLNPVLTSFYRGIFFKLSCFQGADPLNNLHMIPAQPGKECQRVELWLQSQARTDAWYPLEDVITMVIRIRLLFFPENDVGLFFERMGAEVLSHLIYCLLIVLGIAGTKLSKRGGDCRAILLRIALEQGNIDSLVRGTLPLPVVEVS